MINPVEQRKKEMEEAFGTSLTTQQLWALVKFAKHVRLRCRNNAAFNNFVNQVFPHARFQQVTKTRISRVTGQPESYPGLQIVVNGQAADSEENEE